MNCVAQNAAVPIFVELRKLTKRKGVLDFILEQLSDVQGKCKPELFFKLLDSGEFTFFFDGYDEIPEGERAEVTASIQQFIEKTPGNKFVMTSRDEMGLVAFPQFQRYTIKPLQKSEAFELLRKYADESLAETLIEKLQLRENSAIHEFLTNPLLTSLLFKSFEYKHIIPLKRHIFYRQVYEALYESHDLTKEGGQFQRTKKSTLDIDRLEQVLRAVGALSYKAGATEFTREAALSFIDGAKTLVSEHRASSSNILHDLTHAVPLLVTDGNYIRWSHRSIQEYFAAQYICKSTKGRHSEILREHYLDKNALNHINLILLCADIDREAYERSIGKEIATALLQEYNAVYSDFDNRIPAHLIQERKQLIVGRPSFILRLGHKKKGENDDESEQEVQEMHMRMLQMYGQGANSTIIHHGNPGIGQINGKLDKFLSQAGRRADLPFISVVVQHNFALHDELPGTIDLAYISDETVAPWNQPNTFAAVNQLLRRHAEWTFDSAAAEEFLKQLAVQSKAQSAAEPW